MPSVEMRRTTRVFGARVLRSGRRLWTEPADEWLDYVEDDEGDSDGIQFKENGWYDDVGLKQDEVVKIEEFDGLIDDENSVDRMWGAVYGRKRKRGVSCNSGKMSALDRMYGKQFSRKQCKRRIGVTPVSKNGDLELDFDVSLAAVVELSCDSVSLFANFLISVLGYMRRVRMRVRQLSEFVLSEPIFHIYSTNGIHFFQDSAPVSGSGVCTISGSMCSIPSFTVDYSAVPFCFMQLHSSLLLRSAWWPYLLVTCSENMETEDNEIMPYLHVTCSENMETDDNEMIIDEEQPSYILREVDPPGSVIVLSENDYIGKMKVSSRMQLRSASSQIIQKRRSSLRSKRVRNNVAFELGEANGGSMTNFLVRHEGIPFSPASCNRVLTRSAKRNSTTSIKELKPSTTSVKESKSLVVRLTNDLDTTSCSTNILVVESDRCYREDGAIVTLEISASRQWFLSVNRDGKRRYCLTALKDMKFCCNRFTHAMLWTSDDNNWKLEFPNRKDWNIFKELYKECSDRNLREPTVNLIPIPGVHEVSGYFKSYSLPFRRPNFYINCKDDELARALAKKTGNYDLDVDDQEWLNKFNIELDKRVSSDTFELIIDAFEKRMYCSPEYYSHANTAADFCLHLEKRDVLEAVHSYWMSKRKHKRSPLVKVFQLYQPRRLQILPKAVIRKKRSFKRQPNPAGRGKQNTLFKAMVAKHNELEEENTCLKVQEAKATLSKSDTQRTMAKQMAILKRQRAQLLMEAADWLTYKATMTFRVAEAACRAQSPNVSDFFLV